MDDGFIQTGHGHLFIWLSAQYPTHIDGSDHVASTKNGANYAGSEKRHDESDDDHLFPDYVLEHAVRIGAILVYIKYIINITAALYQ